MNTLNSNRIIDAAMITLNDVLRVTNSHYPYEPVTDPKDILTWEQVCCGQLSHLRLYYRQRLGLENTVFPCADVSNSAYMEMVKPPDAILRKMLLDCPEVAMEYSVVFKVTRPNITTFMLSLENEDPAYHFLQYLNENKEKEIHSKLHKLITWLNGEVGKLRNQWIEKSQEWEKKLPGIAIGGKVYWKVPSID